MKPNWVIGLIAAFVVFTVIACICEMRYIGEGDVSKLQQLLQPDFPDYKIPILGQIAAFVTVAWDYVQVLWDMFWWDYPFFEGSWSLVRYILFIPLSIGAVVALVLATFRGVSSG